MNKSDHHKAITELKQLDLSGTYFYKDYLTWTFDERVELIRGKIFPKGPNPGTQHQQIVGRLLVEFLNYFKENKDKYSRKLIGPQAFTYLDVRLPIPNKKTGEGDTVVQPDILVVLDENKFDERGCKGCPDLVVEVLPRIELDAKIEYKQKFNIYQAAKISEYWLIDPERKSGIIYSLDKKGKYIGSPFFTSGQQMESKVIKGFKFDMDQWISGLME